MGMEMFALDCRLEHSLFFQSLCLVLFDWCTLWASQIEGCQSCMLNKILRSCLGNFSDLSAGEFSWYLSGVITFSFKSLWMFNTVFFVTKCHGAISLSGLADFFVMHYIALVLKMIWLCSRCSARQETFGRANVHLLQLHARSSSSCDCLWGFCKSLSLWKSAYVVARSLACMLEIIRPCPYGDLLSLASSVPPLQLWHYHYQGMWVSVMTLMNCSNAVPHKSCCDPDGTPWIMWI